jgi:hypothetical protein
MAANFGWIDFSDEQRQKVYAVIDLLDSGGTVDELGVGVVRDALADWMFPGVSTIQTRPKYFLIITEILSNYQRKYLNKEKIPSLNEYLNEEENRIMKVLARNYNFKDGNGVIGISIARENSELARKPSSIYWNGLRIHGLVDTQHSKNEYAKANDLSEREKDDETLDNYEDQFGLKALDSPVIHDEMKMDLDEEQADFLRDQFLDTDSHIDKNEHNLLSALLKTNERAAIFKSSNSFLEAGELLLETGDLHPTTARIVKIALDFDFLMHGAHIRYNIQLHAKAGNPDFQEYLEEVWESWLTVLELEKRQSLLEFDFDEVFTQIATRVGPMTKHFMRSWQEAILQEDIDLEKLDDLVFNQEKNKKGSKAKLILKDGEYDGWIGIQGLGYRFDSVKNIIQDLEIANA